MEAIRHSYDRRSHPNREPSADRLRPRTSLLIHVHDVPREVESMEAIAVYRPAGPLGQRDQLVQAVRDRFPGSRLHRVSDAGVVFTCGNCVVTACYSRPVS
jgi:hypothetical protein